jgi:hypothetical protein
MVLPEHPYNLELFTNRIEPLVKGTLSPQFQTVSYNSGAIFRYKKKPYFLNINYLRSSNEYSLSTSITTKYGMLGTYYKELVKGDSYSFSASYDHQTSGPVSVTSSDNAALTNTVAFSKFHISSGLTFHRADQTGGVQGISIASKDMSWTERCHLHLPWNFSSDLAYGLTRDWLTLKGASIPEAKVSATVQNAQFTLTHKLYESLVSSYNMGYTSSNSDGGQSHTFSSSLDFSYIKKIPGGRLRASFSVGNSDIKNKGIRSIANEPHSGVGVPFGNITLNNQDVDTATLIVFVKSTDVSGEQFLLRENIDYFVVLFGNTVQINIINLPPQFAVPGTYDFTVSYSLKSQESEFSVTNLSASISFDLFKDTFVPYWNHSESRQTVKEGAATALPFNISSDVGGFTFRRMPFSASGQYFVTRSNVNPANGWKGELRYQDSVLGLTQVQAGVTYSSTSYPQGIVENGNTTGYTDTMLGFSAGVQQRIKKRNMFLYAGGAYSQERGLGNVSSYSLNMSFAWFVGKLSINAGGTVSVSKNETLDVSNKRTDQYYYLSVKRRLL